MSTWKTWLLMGMLSVLLVLCGSLIGGALGAVAAFGLSLLMNLAGYWYSDRISLRLSGAEPMSETEQPNVYAMVRTLSARAGVPMPRLYVIPEAQPNAFATGRNPENAVVTVTQGLLDLMNREEIEGVLAHELAHIQNRDILVGSLAAAFAGAIATLANIAQWALIFGGGSQQDDDEEGAGGMIGSLLMIILAPLAASLVQLSISRSREYLADATAAHLVGSSRGLVQALAKLSVWTQHIPMRVNPGTAHMYVAQPLSGSWFLGLFSTHPPMEERIRRLQALDLRG